MKNPLLILSLSIGIILSCTFVSSAQCTFMISNPNPCPGELVNFSVINPMTDSIYTWDYTNNGSIDATGTSVNTSFPYNTSAMTYTVKLFKNGVSCAMQSVNVKASPDASIGLDPGQSSPGTTISVSGDTIKTCSSNPNSTVAIYNASTTFNSNNSYEINWGDGVIQNFNNITFSSSISIVHMYNSYGYKYITVKVTHMNGCVRIRNYVYYNGSNPSVGLTNPGGTVGLCTPSTITFPINNTANNPPGTVYTISVNGTVVQSYNQSNIPSSFTYTFGQTSCNEVTTSGAFQNAFDLRILASNPCGSSAATVEPIELSTPPVADFIITEPANECPGENWIFTDNSTNISEVISGNPSICNDSIPPSWQISPGTNGNQWNIVSGNLFASEELVVEFLAPGVYFIRMIVTSSICQPDTIIKQVTVLEPPTADANAFFNTPTGCVPTTVTFDNLSTGYQVSYNWTISPPSGWTFTNGTSSSSENPSINFTTAGTYNVMLTSTNICDMDTWDTSLVFITKPVITWSDIPDVCLTATLNFNSSNVTFSSPGTPITNYQWSFPGGSPSSSTTQYPSNIVYNTPGTYTVSVSATNICGTTTLSQTFIIQAPGTIIMPPNFQLCVDAAPVTLMATPTGGTWSGTGVTPQGVFNPSIANIGNNILTYGYGNGVCSSTSTVTANVIQLPSVNAGNNLSACSGTSPVALNGTPPGGIWTSSAGGVLNGNAFNPSSSPPGTYTLTYNYINAQGCDSADNLTFTVFPLPIVSANDTTYCNSPGTVQLPFASPAGGTWIGPGIVNNQFNPMNAGGVGTYMATYSFSNANNCFNSTTIQINVINPTSVTAGPDTSLCASITTYNLAQYSNPPGGTWTTSGNGLNGSVYNPSLAGTGPHTLTYSVGAGNCLVTDQLVITVNPLPTVNAGVDQSACVSANPVLLSGSPAGGNWTSSAGGVLNGNLFSPQASGSGNYTLTFTLTSAQGCVNADNMNFLVYPLPVVTANDTTYCNTPGTVQLPFASPLGGIWNGPGIVNNQFNPISAGGVGTYEASYSFTNANNCTDSTIIQIYVINPANVTAGPDTSFCISVTSYNLAQLSNPPGGTWTTSGGGLSGSIFNPSQAGAGPHQLTYSVGAGNCLVTDQLVITVNPLPTVNAGVDQSACVSADPVALSGNPAGGAWTSSSGGSLNGNLFSPQASGSGNYILTYTLTSAQGCVNADNLNFIVFPLPVVTANDTTYCNTPGAVQLPFASPVGGTWNGPGIINNQFNPINAGGVGTYAATYSFTNVNNCTDSTIIQINVINPANVTAGPDTSFCISVTSYNLAQLSNPPGGTWTTSGGGLSGSLYNPSLAGAGPHTLIYSVGAGNCLVSDQVIITVNPLPIVNAGIDLSNCISVGPIILYGSPTGGTWTNSSGNVLNGNIFYPDVYGPGAHPLTYTFTDALGCINEDNLVYTVFPLPVISANDTTYCNTPGSVQLPYTNPSGGIWEGSGVNGGLFDPMAAGGVGSYQLSYIFTDNNSCTDSTSITVSVIEPAIVEAGSNDTLCVDQGVFQLPGFSPPGGTWSGIGIIDAQQGLFEPSLAGGGNVSLIYSVGTGNCQVKDSIEIFVIQIEVEPGTDEEFCLDNPSIQLSGFSPIGGYWTGLGIVDSISGIFDIALAGVGSHPITYIYNDPILGCEFSASKTITVHAMPDSYFEIPAEACINNVIQFNNLSQNTYQVTWNFGDGVSSTLVNPTHIYTSPGWYTITLITTTEFGCTDSYSTDLFVTEPPVVSFDSDINEGCAILEVNFTNYSYGYQISYVWDFGNGQTDTVAQPSTIFFDQGNSDTTYLVTLTVSNQCATLSVTDSITVFPLPLVNFGTSIDTSCSPMVVEFTNLTLGNPESFYWNFGNGNTSTDSIPLFQTYYTDTSYVTYPITLISTNFCGTDTATQEIVVTPANVSAFFNIPNNTGCQPFTVSFTNYSTSGASVFWNFGDGNSSNLPNPDYTFQQPGSFTVIQYASTGCGYDSTIATINVLPAPVIEFEHAAAVCLGDSVQFINTTSEALAGTLWHFGDGDSSLLNSPFHVYDQPGTFNVTLQGISNINGCYAEKTNEILVWELPIVDFSPSAPDGCVPLTLSFANLSNGADYYTWDFGDGNTAVGMETIHIYFVDGSYPVTLTGTDLNGCSDTSIYNLIQVYPIPIAEFTMERDVLCGIPVMLSLTNTSQGAQGYSWSFGDGSISALVNPVHEYNAQGYYEVTLIAENAYTCRDTIIKPFNVYLVPMAEFEALPGLGCEPLSVSFQNTSTGSNTYYWNLGDQQISIEENPNHIYVNEGEYGVELIASFDDVCFDTIYVANAVTVLPTPFANFSYEEVSQGTPAGIIQFYNLSEDATTYNWDFGDGGVSNEADPLHRYYENGIWQVYLEAIGSNGCKDDTLLQVQPVFFRGLFIPNAFSPEQGLGEVRLFKPKGIGLKEYRIEVFSPYGQLVWSSEELIDGQPLAAWDGTYNGQLLPQDVYVWKAYGIFEDGTVWQGMADKSGELKTLGSLLLLR